MRGLKGPKRGNGLALRIPSNYIADESLGTLIIRGKNIGFHIYVYEYDWDDNWH
jgi:hypothetical protein